MAKKQRATGASTKKREPKRADVPLPRRPRRFWWIASIVVLVASFASVGYYRATAGPGYPLDDTWIHLAFARNVASGLGFGANAHEPTPGATSPLWVMLLAPGFLFGAVHATWPWILAAFVLAAAGVACGALVLALVRTTVPDAPPSAAWLGLVCAVTVVWTAPLVWSAAGAMEVPLFVALISAALLAFATRRSRGWRGGLVWGALAGATALARPEGLILAPLFAVILLWRPTRGALLEAGAGILACAVVYSPSVVFCLRTSGLVFPNTFYAKTTALVAGGPDVQFLRGVVAVLRGISPVGLAALFVGLAGTVVALWRRVDARGVAATAGFAVGLPLAYAVMGRTTFFAPFAGNFGRYLYPVLPPALVLGFWTVAWAMFALPRRAVVLVGLVLVVLAPVLSVPKALDTARLYRHNVRDVNTMQVAMAHSLETKLAPGDLVAANDVGALAYFTKFRVLDLIGIVSTPTLRALAPANKEPNAMARAHYALLLKERPVALVVFPQWFDAPLRALGPIAQPIETITNQSNITSPWPTLVAYRLNWPDRR